MKSKKNIVVRFILLCAMQIIPFIDMQSQLLHNPETKYSRYGARASAFAGAYATEIHDISSMYWNPAAIAYLENNSIAWNYYTDWDGKSRSQMIAAPFFISNNSVIAVGATAEQFRFTDGFDAVQTVVSYGMDAAIAVRAAPTLSIGVLGLMKHVRMGNTSIEVLSSSVALLYKPGPEISYGAIYRGFGNIFQYTLIDNTAVLRRIPMPRNLQIGLTWNFPSAKSERTFSLALANDKTFGKTGIRYNGAFEWRVTNFFELRAGYVVDNAYAGAKYGVGINLGGIKADYAISPSKLTNRFQEFTFSLDL